ncbi:hypothetical protein C8Q76DRAFT_794389 [Earliella scabrosa]|nr:hypothetical protein C8Q76DRAFT_794389 [Earliella scabrosa]
MSPAQNVADDVIPSTLVRKFSADVAERSLPHAGTGPSLTLAAAGVPDLSFHPTERLDSSARMVVASANRDAFIAPHRILSTFAAMLHQTIPADTLLDSSHSPSLTAALPSSRRTRPARPSSFASSSLSLVHAQQDILLLPSQASASFGLANVR